MASIRGSEFERNRNEFDFKLYNMQMENLRLSNKQLKRYWLYSLIGFFAGFLVTIASQYTSDKLSEDRQSDTKTITLEQTVNRLRDSIQILKAYDTTLKH